MSDLPILADALEFVAENSERWARGPYNDGPFSEELLRTHNEIGGVLKELAAVIRIRAASADTHPKGGDVKQAPLVSGAVGEAETPKGNPDARKEGS